MRCFRGLIEGLQEPEGFPNADQRPEKDSLADLMSVRVVLRYERADVRPEKASWRLVRADLRLERSELRLERPYRTDSKP